MVAGASRDAKELVIVLIVMAISGQTQQVHATAVIAYVM
jgi:hypothetical protein